MHQMSEPVRAHAKREQIRRGAQSLFLRLGYERASMDAIAAEAGVSKQTLYRYYPTKDALFVDILRQMTVGSFLRDVPALADDSPLISQADLETTLRGFMTSASEYLLAPAYVAMLRVLIAEAPRFPELAEQMRATLIAQGSAALSRLLSRAYHARIIAQPPTEETLLLLVAPLLAHLLADGLISGSELPKKPLPETLATYVHLFMAAIT
jgi:TetR/AcrR family transcriptional regulator, mexJK operon transcriptional repressor